MATFQEIITSGKPVLVDFFAEWCGPCKMMPPILEQVVKELGEKVTVLKIDVDKNPEAASHFQISGVPTLMVFKDGKVQWRESGVIPAAELVKLLQRYL